MGLLDLVFPTRCAGCDAPGTLACASCLSPLRRPARSASPRPRPSGLPATWTVAEYDGPVRDLLIGYKERGRIGLRGSLATALAQSLSAACAAAAPGDLLVVPVPSSQHAVRERGDDVVAALAARAAVQLRSMGHPVRVAPALRQRAGVRDSAGLSAVARAANLAGALAVRPGWARRIAGAQVVLADDLITTGASLTEAARVLRAAGADVCAAATIAATMRHFGW